MLSVDVEPPSTVEIVSPPAPPITIALPEPVWMLSPAPKPGSVVWTMPSVIGSVPNGNVLSWAAKMRPSSPRITFVPVPPVIVSTPTPPTTIAWPAPTVILSSPPSVGSVDATRSMNSGLVFAPAVSRPCGSYAEPQVM